MIIVPVSLPKSIKDSAIFFLTSGYCVPIEKTAKIVSEPYHNGETKRRNTMSQEDGSCPFCSESLDPSSPICPSCRRNIFQSQVDDSDRYKIQPRPPSIA